MPERIHTVTATKESQMKKFTFMFLLLILAGCAATEGIVSVGKDLFGTSKYESFEGKFISQAELDRIKKRDDELTGKGSVIAFTGKNISINEIRDVNLVKAPRIQNYLQEICDDILLQWTGSPVKAKINITSQVVFSPSADYLGNIYIPIGMLANVESEDELAMMIAHEVSHLLLRHHERKEAFDEQRTLITTFAGAIVAANIAKDSSVDTEGGKLSINYNASSSGQKNIVKAVVYQQLINSISDVALSNAWGRVQEEEADLLALDLAVAAGYAPRASENALMKLASIESESKVQEAILQEEQSNSLQEVFSSGNIDGISSELSLRVSGFLSDGVSWIKDKLNRSHDSAESRATNISLYAEREYLEQVFLLDNKANWKSFKEQKDINDILEGYLLSQKALLEIANGNLEEAETLARQSQNPHTKNQPEIREVMYHLRVSQGNISRAEQNLFLVDDWNYASRSMFEKMLEVQIKNGKYSDALETVELAENRLYTSDAFNFYKGVALNQVGKKEEAKKTLNQCLETEAYKEQCRKVLNSLAI